MKKNLIALAVAGAMIAPVVASAADVTIFGDARVRYTMNDDALAAAGAQSSAQTTSRVRVGFKATEGNTMVTARMKATNGTHESNVAASGADNDGNVDVDYGYMSAKVAGVVDVAAGKMVANWGNKLLLWDGRFDRVMLSTSMINNVWMGIAFDKYVENGAQNDGDGDHSATKLMAKFKVGGGDLGVLYVMDENNTALPAGAAVETDVMDVYYNGKVGPVALGVEFYNSSNNVAGSKDASALMITAGMKTGPVDLTAMVLSLADGGKASAFVDPFSTIGTNQDTAVANFETAAGEDMSVFGVVAAMPVNDALTVQGGLGMATVSPTVGADTDISIFDLQATYKVDAKTAIRASYGTLTADSNGTDVADETVIGVRMQTSF